MAEPMACGPLIKLLHDRLEKQANNTLREKDLTLMQISVLMALEQAEQAQLPMKELERRFGVAQSTVAGIVSRLEQKGFVEPAGDAADKRVKLVRMTAAGRDCCAEAAGYMDAAEQKLLHGFSDTERRTFCALLRRAADNLH